MHVGRSQLGIDAYAFENLPVTWNGERNPLVLAGAMPSPSNAYKLSLTEAEATLKRVGSSEHRRKLRKKEQALTVSGKLLYRMARNEAEVEEILGAFYRQKAERFAELGIRNPFDDEGSRQFVRAACLAGLDHGLPAIELHGLWLDDRIIATYSGAVDRQRFSCMFNSFESSAAIARNSPGDVLLMKVIRTQCELGRSVLDLGVGEARYKSLVCDETDELVDLFLPVTTKGRLYAGARAQVARAKRLVKQTPWAWSVVRTARAARAKLGL
jgi:CelD/BcsL family acetyltransferase involved in cellulose biosynthesis